MKSLSNSKQQCYLKCEQSINKTHKDLAYLQCRNEDQQQNIKKLQKELQDLKQQSTKLDEQISTYEFKLSEIQNKKEQQEKNGEQEEQQMNKWIEQVQKYNGLSSAALQMLVTIQYDSNCEQQICLYCYKNFEMKAQVKYLPCYHLFHAQCINNHLMVNKICPACQQQVIL